MARPQIPAHVIAQRGKPVELFGGETVTVVYTFSSLMTIEEHFGSIAGALAAVQQQHRGAAFTSLCTILAAGLEHVERREDGTDYSNPEHLRMLLDPRLFETYSDQMGEALSDAFPDSDEDKAGEDDADPQMDSRGESGTTSPSSPSDVLSASSGG